jgi:hypothetical protein
MPPDRAKGWQREDREGYCPQTGGAGKCGMQKRIAAKKITRCSMKLDRELIALSKTRSPAVIAAKVQRPPESVLKRASRLGLSIKQNRE